MASWLRTDPCFSLVDSRIFALRVRVSVRVATAYAWVKTRQGIEASKVMEGGQSCVCVRVRVCAQGKACVAANTKPQEEQFLVSFVRLATFRDRVLVVDRSVCPRNFEY
jgi:hypothetical protein